MTIWNSFQHSTRFSFNTLVKTKLVIVANVSSFNLINSFIKLPFISLNQNTFDKNYCFNDCENILFVIGYKYFSKYNTTTQTNKISWTEPLNLMSGFKWSKFKTRRSRVYKIPNFINAPTLPAISIFMVPVRRLGVGFKSWLVLIGLQIQILKYNFQNLF